MLSISIKKLLINILLLTVIITSVFSPWTTPQAKAVDAIDAAFAECSFLGGDFMCVVIQAIYYIFYVVTSFVLRLSGGIFDIFMSFTLDSNYLNVPAVIQTWIILRDFANMLFILVLIYISITIILGIEQFGGSKMLVSVIVIALIINFSLAGSRVVIDAGNITANVFYNAMGQVGKDGYRVISGAFLQVSNPAKIVGVGNFTSWIKDGENENYGAAIFVVLAGAALNLVFAYYLFIGGFLLITRTGWLWILMSVAPLAFIASTLPMAGGYFSQWWKKLLNLAFCPTVLLFLLWLSLSIIGPLGSSLPGIFGGSTGVKGFINIIIVVVLQAGITAMLLSLSINISKKVCDSGAVGQWGEGLVGGIKDKVVGGIKGAARGATVGATQRALRGTIGRGAQRLSESAAVRNVAARSAVGALGLRTIQGVAGSGFGTGVSHQAARQRSVAQRMRFAQSLEATPEEITSLGRAGAEMQASRRVGEYAGRISAPTILNRIQERAFRPGGEEAAKKIESKYDIKNKENMIKIEQINLKRERDKLQNMERDPSVDSVSLQTQRDTVHGVEDRVDKLNKDIEKIKESLKKYETNP